MIGNISDGWKIVGPFPTWDEACLWADENITEEMTWIASIYTPQQYLKIQRF